MVARDEPLAVHPGLPAIRERIAGVHDLPRGAVGEGVQAGVHGGIAADVHEAQVDLAGRPVPQEMLEVVFLVGRRQARHVGHGRQQDRMRRIVRGNLVRVARLKRSVPAVEQRGDLLFAGAATLVSLAALRDRRPGAACQHGADRGCDAACEEEGFGQPCRPQYGPAHSALLSATMPAHHRRWTAPMLIRSCPVERRY